MKYIQVNFTLSPDSQVARDLVMALAGDCGFESFTDDEEGLVGYCQDTLYDKNGLEEALNNFPMEAVEVAFTAKDAEYKNWNEEWEKGGFEPIVIEDKCVIECYRAENQFPNIPLHIQIDAKQAFGTGTHETTQMIVATLLSLSLEGKRVLDCGCGTGILSIVAAKLGANEVIGYDIDEWSVANAQHNAEINRVTLDVLEGDKKVLSHVCGVFDVVMANINRNILLDDMETYAEVLAHDGIMVLSGFYKGDADLLLEKASTLNLELCQQKENHDWCSLVLRKS